MIEDQDAMVPLGFLCRHIGYDETFGIEAQIPVIICGLALEPSCSEMFFSAKVCREDGGEIVLVDSHLASFYRAGPRADGLPPHVLLPQRVFVGKGQLISLTVTCEPVLGRRMALGGYFVGWPTRDGVVTL